MAVSCATALVASVLGCMLTSITAPGIGGISIAVMAILAAMSPVPIYWHEKGHEDRRESTLVILWAVVLAAILRYPLLIAARLRMPLRDSLFASIDRSLGVNVPAIVQWAVRHSWVGIVLNNSYSLLLPLLLIAIFLPALAGKRKEAQEFIVSNGIAFAIAVPLFTLFPAVGPWAVYHFAARMDQQQCESLLLALRISRTFLAMPGQDAAIMCFPSFHVVWAVLSARSLWGFRSLRIPASALAALILISTMTTGWHYFVDVLGGLAVAVVSILVAKSYLLGMHASRGWLSTSPFERAPAEVCNIKVKGIAAQR